MDLYKMVSSKRAPDLLQKGGAEVFEIIDKAVGGKKEGKKYIGSEKISKKLEMIRKKHRDALLKSKSRNALSEVEI